MDENEKKAKFPLPSNMKEKTSRVPRCFLCMERYQKRIKSVPELVK